ncbi:WSC-domain-containing protein [Aureobasidium subglaciale]|nr:WSC-domain-containing protein [Aureobasidium subglaciale]KAI5231095.1 WSC-domain-containing protein [Aureobasidium subglaciale]KAI5234238.1 WSC-domain-containing protein [Aureobasidium subglaciale]KAI5267537.1 WSC-domain-containing protein [Aureobasidium subglaciale]
MMYTSTKVFGLAAALAAPAAAFFRMPCPGRIVTERADPIVSPGQVAGHVHTISGGNGFKFEMDYADTQASDCSSCPIKQDLSNYWTPSLYYQHQNGSFENVHQSGDGTGIYGGMTVYYLQRPGPNNDALKAFPEGFRMLAGNPFKRNHTDDFASKAVSFVCLDYSGGSSTTDGLPTKKCPDGLRAQIFFPSCWDGVNLDSADHASHMSYPIGGSYDSGKCPSTHPVHLVSIFYEVNYNTGDFDDQWYGSGQPFVFAMGDPTGYGFHGDFVNGWNVPTLQKAIDECNNDSGLLSDCPVFDLFTTKESQACIIPPQVDEQVTGMLDALPGCNPVQKGPGLATPQSCSTNSRVATVGAYQQYYKDVTSSLKWQYVGCGTDNLSSRTLNSASTSSNSMTVESCISYCEGKGYSYAGLEYASQCYCGNSVASDRLPVDGVLGNCFTPCTGDSTEYCGGGSALSLYQSCKGTSSCTNNAYTGPGGSSGSSSSAASSAASSSSKSGSSSKTSSTSTTKTSSTSSTKTATTLATSSKPASSSKSSSTSTSKSSSTTKTGPSPPPGPRKQKAPYSATKNARFAAAVAWEEEADRQAAEVKVKLAASKVRRHLAELKAGRHH